MPHPGTWSHGPWVLTKPHWSQPWIATHTDTGEVIDTECHNVQEAMDTLPVPDQDRPGHAVSGRYTLAPKRTTADPKGWNIPQPPPARTTRERK